MGRLSALLAQCGHTASRAGGDPMVERILVVGTDRMGEVQNRGESRRGAILGVWNHVEPLSLG